MVDKWHAECLPCKWLTLHDTQDAAIAAAEDHVFELHRKLTPFERGRDYIGHVQNRTVGAIEHPKDARTVDPVQPVNSFPGDGLANLPPASSSAPGEVDTKPAQES